MHGTATVSFDSKNTRGLMAEKGLMNRRAMSSPFPKPFREYSAIRKGNWLVLQEREDNTPETSNRGGHFAPLQDTWAPPDI
jgi:hypothetical protein